MDGHDHHRLEHGLHIGALIGALLSIPVVILQSSERHDLHEIGNIASIAIWLFFVLEVTILLRIAPDNWLWIRHHKLEFVVVIASAPILTQLGDSGSVFGFAPLLIVPRIFQLFKFAKFAKIGKLLKSLKIIRKDDVAPEWIETVVWCVVLIATVGIVGMIVDKESYNIVHGLLYWRELLAEVSGIESPYILGSCGVVAVSLIAVLLKRGRVSTTVDVT